MRLLPLFVLLIAGGCTINVYPTGTGQPLGGTETALRDVLRQVEARKHAMKRENLDALVQTAVRIASDVQVWALKPKAFGGGGGSFGDVTFEQLGYAVQPDDQLPTLDGWFVLETEAETVRIVGTNGQYGNRVIVTVAGSEAADLSTRIEPM